MDAPGRPLNIAGWLAREQSAEAGKWRPQSLRVRVPDVEELIVGGGGDRAVELARGAVQRRTDIDLGVGQRGEGDLERSSGFQAFQVVEDGGDDFLVLAVASGGH